MRPEKGAGPSPETLRVLESVPDHYLILTPDLYIITASNSYLLLTGKQRAAISGLFLFDIFPEGDPHIRSSLAKVIRTGETDELPLTRFDVADSTGTLQERYWKTSHTPVFDETGCLNYIIHRTEEMTEAVLTKKRLNLSLATEQRAASQASRLSQQLDRLFQDIPAQIVMFMGPDLVFDYVNPAYIRELFPDRDILGLPLLVAVPELTDQPITAALQKVYETGETYSSPEIYIPLAERTGAPLLDHYYNVIYQALKGDNGEIIGVLGFKYEITQLVLARKDLEAKEQELYVINEELAQANEEVLSSNEELRATNDELHDAHSIMRDQNLHLESRVKVRTTELLWAQRESDNQRERLHRFFMQAPAAICVLDGPDFVFELVNPLYQQLLPGRELVGKPILEAMPELSDQALPSILREVYRSGKTYEGNELLVALADATGKLQDRYFNFIYQARQTAEGHSDGILVFAFDITEMVLNRQKEQATEQRFHFLLDAIPQQVWTATPDGLINYVNDVVCNDFGHMEADITGEGWQQFIHPEDQQSAFHKWAVALRTNTEYMIEFRLKFADGKFYWHLARALPLIEDGKATLWLGTNTNIDLQKSNEHKKDEFISIASHELKTPLTTVKAFFQLAKREIAPDKKLNVFVDKADRQLERLGRLIEDLLDVSKINAGKMTYNREQFNFRELLAESIESVQQTASRHQINLLMKENFGYEGDQHRIEQVVINLLNNAVKYAPDGGEITVTCELEDDNIIVAVTDPGIGIAEEHLKGLFDRFYRVDNSSSRFQGLGLGLFISAEIVKRHGGSFWIESEIGRGSTFSFLLPRSGTLQMSELATDQKTYYESNFVKINYRAETQLLDVDWIGYQNYDSVVKGCLIMLDLLKKNNCTKVLNDNTRVRGNWSEASDWGASTWFPAMADAGLTKFAWIYSPSTFSRIASDKSVPAIYNEAQIAFFYEKAQAMDWLQLP
jgi:PAS domain S-box-containing protein